MILKNVLQKQYYQESFLNANTLSLKKNNFKKF